MKGDLPRAVSMEAGLAVTAMSIDVKISSPSDLDRKSIVVEYLQHGLHFSYTSLYASNSAS